MKPVCRIDELLLQLADGRISKAEEKELFSLTDKRSVDGYLAVIELEDELSKVDSSLPVDFQSKVFDGIANSRIESKVLKDAFYSSFKNTLLGLTALILVIGPSRIISSVSYLRPSSSNVSLANSFQTRSIIASHESSISGNGKNELTVLIELVDGATKQKEFVTAVLKIDSKSGGEASLVMPRYEASVLKEFEKRVAL